MTGEHEPDRPASTARGITSLYVHNFKSLVDFNLKLAPFACLIGLNGSGKSTVLQLVDFLAQQARGDLKGWLDERGWKAADLNSRLVPRKNVDFRVSAHPTAAIGPVSWSGSFNTTSLRCTTERIETKDALLEVREGRYTIQEHDPAPTVAGVARNAPIEFEYEGSILSQFRERKLPWSLQRFREYLTSITPLILLSPQFLRRRTRDSGGSLGLGGEKIAAYLYEMEASDRRRLFDHLRHAYPHLSHLRSKPLRSGWKQLEIEEAFGSNTIRTEAAHVNDGLLRMTAILAELGSERPLVLFDEIENGINPELVELLINAMLNAKQQVIVTTHSPLILNYLTDEQARAGVVYLHRNSAGASRAVHFFSIPSLAKKLSVMGPGEAFVDTNLTQLEAEVREMAPVE